MKRFEYCYIENVSVGMVQNGKLIFPNGQKKTLKDKQLADVLNDLGKDGWEMVGCGVYYTSDHIIYFKREING
jgi:hypothetical protein